MQAFPNCKTKRSPARNAALRVMQAFLCLLVYCAPQCTLTANDFGLDEHAEAQLFRCPEACGCASCCAEARPGRMCLPDTLFCNTSTCPRWWLGGEYLHWWPNQRGNVALLTTSSAGTSTGASGILGAPSTSILADSRDLSEQGMNGWRVSAGLWMDDQQSRAWEGSYFGVQSNTSRNFDSTTTAILARPYLSGTAGTTPAALLIAHPSFLSGNVETSQSSHLQGADIGMRFALGDRQASRLYWTGGYRYVGLDEDLSVNSFSRYTVAQGPIAQGTTTSISDQFGTRNQFHGGQLGLYYRESLRCFTLDVKGRIAFGGTTSESRINGQTVNTVPGAGSATIVGGLYAQSTNIGSLERKSFSVVPDLHVGITTCVTSRVKANVGYDLLAWTNAMRVTDQIDTTLSQLPPEAPQGARRPSVIGDRSTFFAQGVSVGMQFDY